MSQFEGSHVVPVACVGSIWKRDEFSCQSYIRSNLHTSFTKFSQPENFSQPRLTFGYLTRSSSKPVTKSESEL